MNNRRKFFDALETVLSYAVDSYMPLDQNPLRKELDLNPESFYEHLYVNREECESELDSVIETCSDGILVVGPAGCGKTSVITRRLSEWRTRRKDLVHTIDFKRRSLTKRDNDVATYVEDELRTFGKRYAESSDFRSTRNGRLDSARRNYPFSGKFFACSAHNYGLTQLAPTSSPGLG